MPKLYKTYHYHNPKKQKVSFGLMKMAAQGRYVQHLQYYLALRFLVKKLGTAFIPYNLVRQFVPYYRLVNLERIGWIKRCKNRNGQKVVKLTSQQIILENHSISDNRYVILNTHQVYEQALMQTIIEVFAVEIQVSKSKHVAYDQKVSKCRRGASISLLAKILGLSTRTVLKYKKLGWWKKGEYKRCRCREHFIGKDGGKIYRVEDRCLSLFDFHYHTSTGAGYRPISHKTHLIEYAAKEKKIVEPPTKKEKLKIERKTIKLTGFSLICD